MQNNTLQITVEDAQEWLGEIGNGHSLKSILVELPYGLFDHDTFPEIKTLDEMCELSDRHLYEIVSDFMTPTRKETQQN